MTSPYRAAANERAAAILKSRASRRAGISAAVPSDLDALDAYLIATHSELKTHEQAAALGVPPYSVMKWRQRLIRAERLDLTIRASHAPISDRERVAVERLWRQGYTARRIAAMREMAPSRVHYILDVLDLRADDREPYYTFMDVRRLLGVGEKTLKRCMDAGLLTAVRLGAVDRGGSRWGVTRADLVDLLRDRRAWPALAPALVEDTELATVLRRAQSESGGTWYDQRALASLTGLGITGVYRWMCAGALSRLERLEIWPPYVYVWLSSAQANHLRDLCAPVRAAAGDSGAVKRAFGGVRGEIDREYGRAL